jgi:hypothetical protein
LAAVRVKVRRLDGCQHWVAIPASWRRVRRGSLKPGDRFLDHFALAGGQVRFDPVTEFPDDPRTPYGAAEWYGLVIRRCEPPGGSSGEQDG